MGMAAGAAAAEVIAKRRIFLTLTLLAGEDKGVHRAAGAGGRLQSPLRHQSSSSFNLANARHSTVSAPP
jgi:hypothetical protein